MQDVKWLKGFQGIYKIEPVQKYSDISIFHGALKVGKDGGWGIVSVVSLEYVWKKGVDKMSGLILKQTLIRIKNACDASIQDVIFKLT